MPVASIGRSDVDKDTEIGELGDKKARIKAVRDHYKQAADADHDNRQLFVEDMKFVNIPGEQWLSEIRTERGKDRLMLQFNRIRVTVKSVINQMRANPGGIKIRGNEEGDKDTAEVLEGLIRNIQNTSDWPAIRDNAAEYQVTGGYSAWRIVTDYADDSAFDQDIKIEGLKNPLCLYCDPCASDMTGADAMWWVYTDKISKSSFKARYPNAEPVSFDEVEFDDDEDWEDEDTVRICEHWWKKPITKNIHLLDDGKTIDDSELEDAKNAGRQIVRSRAIDTHEIWSAIYSGDAELTKPAKWAGKHFPWIRVYGEYIVIEGKVHWYGLTRHAKDPQRAHNHALTAATEAVLSAPVNQNQIWATAKQAEGLVGHWAESIRKNDPVQIYNFDAQAPGPPQRIPPPTMPVAQIQFSQVMGEELKSTSGFFDASLGAQGNETSGRAIQARDAQGQMATFNYRSNFATAERRMGVILVDLIPKVIDTPRAMRILGSDDSEKYVKVNQPDGMGNVVNDLSRGKFDVVVDVGPSFATKRMEAAETLTNLAQADQTLMPIAGDLIVKSMDIPYAEEIAERKRMMLPPQIQEQIKQDKPLPPEVMQAKLQVDQAMQQVQQQGQLVQQAAQEAQQEKAQADKAKSDVQIAIANLKTQEAQLAAAEAQFKQLVAETQAKMTAEQKDTNSATEREQLAAALSQALGQIQQQSAEFMQQSLAVMAQIQESQKPTVIIPPEQPKPRIIAVKRGENGMIIPIYDDQQTVQ